MASDCRCSLQNPYVTCVCNGAKELKKQWQRRGADRWVQRAEEDRETGWGGGRNRKRDPEEELERLGGKVPLPPVGLCLSILDLPSSSLNSPLHS